MLMAHHRVTGRFYPLVARPSVLPSHHPPLPTGPTLRRRTRQGRALPPASAVPARLLAAGCPAPARHPEQPAAGQGQDVRATDAPTGGTAHSLTVAGAPAATA